MFGIHEDGSKSRAPKLENESKPHNAHHFNYHIHKETKVELPVRSSGENLGLYFKIS